MIKGLAVSITTLSLALSPLVMAQTTPSPTTPADTSTGPASTSPQGATTSSPNNALPMGEANVVTGWSVKKKIMGKNVENEKDEKIGDIRDLIVDKTGRVTHYIIGAGGFLGMGEHDVAIPFDRITLTGDVFRLNGYTKDQLKALPKAQID